MALVDPQEPDLELEAADRLVDEVGQPRVEHGVVVPAHLMRAFLVVTATWPIPAAPVTNPPRAAICKRLAAGTFARVKTSCVRPFGSGEPDQPLDTAQRRLLGGALGDGHAVLPIAGQDRVEVRGRPAATRAR